MTRARSTRRGSSRLCLVALGVACASEPGVRSLTVPPPDGFASVSTALGKRCGSLDCHGRSEQNLRLYGEIGLRLDALDLPGGEEATLLEHEANYRSIIAFEPEVLELVWLEGGRSPARLTLVRKARGREAHKGGSVFPEGDAGDVCLSSWLSGATDVEQCDAASELPASPFAP